jgi:hypothetical protein
MQCLALGYDPRVMMSLALALEKTEMGMKW